MPRQSSLSNLLLVLGAWMTVQMLLRFTGMIVTVLVVSLAGAAAAMIYGLRYERRLMAKLYQRVLWKKWIEAVCHYSQQQLPAEMTVDGVSDTLLLKTSDDFDWCARQVKQSVFGHDHAVEAIVEHLRKAVSLRGRIDRQSLPPLGAFWLAGPPGIGKRLLAIRLAQRLFRHGAVTVLDLSDYADESAVGRLCGVTGPDGSLVLPVRQQPFHTVILENAEAAHPKVWQMLQSLLQFGQCSAGTGSVSFQNCLVFLTSPSLPPECQSNSATSREPLLAALSEHTGCPKALFELASDCLCLRRLDDVTKARVLLQLMADECQRYELQLDYVDPRIVVREVEHFSEVTGCESSKIRIARWISDPIHLAVTHGLRNLVLTQDFVERCQSTSASLENVTSNRLVLAH